jgi:hypothetical protein
MGPETIPDWEKEKKQMQMNSCSVMNFFIAVN